MNFIDLLSRIESTITIDTIHIELVDPKSSELPESWWNGSRISIGSIDIRYHLKFDTEWLNEIISFLMIYHL